MLSPLQYGSLFVALLIYAVLGEPTPERVTAVEAALAILLIIGASYQGISALFLPFYSAGHDRNHKNWLLIGHALAVYAFTLPLMLALFQGASLSEVARDLIAFIFLMLPLLYQHLFYRAHGFRRLFISGVLVVGVCFSFRALLPYLSDNSILGRQDSELYLTIVPAVLFSALYLLAVSLLRVSARNGRDLYNYLTAIVYFALATLPIMAVTLTLQRASVAALVVFSVVCFVYLMVYRPESLLKLGIVTIIVFVSLGEFLGDALLRLESKHLQVGLNSRLDEARTVIELITYSPGRFLFGYGWGALFENPAVGKMEVGYTHNIFTYFLYKTGVVGAVLLGCYLWSLFSENLRILRINLPLGFALLLPLLISSFFYASYKSFSYGLLLMVVSAITRRNIASPVEPAHNLVYANKP